MLTGGLRSAPAAVPHASRAAVSMALENMFGEMISITPGMKTYMMGAVSYTHLTLPTILRV